MRRSLAVAAASSLLVACAAPVLAVDCPAGRGIYRGVTQPTNQLTFASDEGGTLTLASGKSKLVLRFKKTSSNGFSRDYIVFSGKNAPDSVILYLESDFSPTKGERSASFLVTPDLPVKFYYWDAFRNRPDAFDLLPNDTWKLTGCAAG